MSWDAWIIFASFWALFVTTPGPNAVNCITVSMTYGFRTSLLCVLAILTQASLFLTLSAFGMTALIANSPEAFAVFKWLGAGFLIYIGIRGWINARHSITHAAPEASDIYIRAFLVATINPKSVAGYLAAFSQFVNPHVPIWQQMGVIFPTALGLTTLSYLGFCALGAGLGRSAMRAILHTGLRRILALCFIIYGILLGLSPAPKGV